MESDAGSFCVFDFFGDKWLKCDNVLQSLRLAILLQLNKFRDVDSTCAKRSQLSLLQDEVDCIRTESVVETDRNNVVV